MLWTIAIVLTVVAAVILVVAATKPNEFRIERRTIVRADPAKVFGYVVDFQRWRAWSPWEGLDPSLKRSYSGAASGKGSAYAWQGNRKAGEGRMEILEAVPSSRVVIRLDFLKPFAAHNTAEFTVIPASGGGTEIVWAMYGPQIFMGKVMSLFVSMDTLIGKDFEKGLENLKRAAEA